VVEALRGSQSIAMFTSSQAARQASLMTHVR
jgi:hypothetical protein